MTAPQPGRWPALLLLPLLAVLNGCGISYGVVTRTPVISPPGGTFTLQPGFSQPITITDATPNASIFYTMDGSKPTPSSTPYTGTIPLTRSATIQAIATSPQDITSFPASATFTVIVPPQLLQAAAPTFTPPAGTYTTAQTVSIADATPNATIYYTTNGTTPTTSSTPYTTPIAVTTSQTLEAIAVAPNYTPSPVASAAYTISIPQPAAAPTFTPPAGTYTTAQTVSIADTTPNATIYYTTNGTTPTTASTPYTTPIPVATSQTISAIAVAPNYTPSPVATAAYIIQPPANTCANPGPGIICTIAGTSTAGYSGDGGPATSAQLGTPWGVALDSAHNLYIGDPNGHLVRKVTAAGIISTVAGTGSSLTSGDGGPATSAGVGSPDEVAVDANNNLYIVDEFCPCVRMVNAAGIISTFAGNGTVGSSGDGGPATTAQLNGPIGIKFDATGNLYIADRYANRIRKVTPAGIISTVAGNGTAGSTGDGGPAINASLNEPYDVAFDASGNMYISEGSGGRVRKVTPRGTISTFAGDGTSGYGGDGGPATSAELNGPHGLAFDPAGNLYISEINNNRVRIVTPAGTISTFAGNGQPTFAGDGGPATGASLSSPETITFDSAANAFIADWANHRVREVFSSTTATPTFTPPAGSYSGSQTVTIASATPNATIYFTTNGTTPTTSSTLYTGPIAVSTTETLEALAIAPGYAPSAIAKASYTIAPPGCTGLPSGDICTVAGNGQYADTGDGGPATSAALGFVADVAVDASGNLYIPELNHCTVRVVNPAGVISTSIGNGTCGYSGDGGPAASAELGQINGLAIDSGGSLYIADVGNHRIRKVTSAGIISTVAGNGTGGYSGDGGPATSAEIGNLQGLVVDSGGNIFFADFDNNRVRKVTPAGIISTVAGNGTFGFSGDGGPATVAELNEPTSVAVDSTGNLYIADLQNVRIRKVTPAGIISTFAGNGVYAFSGDGGPATSASLENPNGVAVDYTGNLYIADQNNNRIRKVTPGGIISTVAGDGPGAYAGDGTPATNAELWQPARIAFDSSGNLYIADSENYRVRKVIH